MTIPKWLYIGGQSFLVQFIVWGLRPASSYQALHLGIRPADLTVLAAAFALPAMLLAVLAGRLTDRLGPRFSMIFGGLACLASTLMIRLQPSSFVWLCAGLATMGTGLLVSTTGQQTLVMHLSAPGKRDAAFGIYTVFVSLGQMLGPAVVGVTAGVDGEPNFSAIVTFEIVIAALLASIAIFPAGKNIGRARTSIKKPTDVASGKVGIKQILKMPGMIPAIVASSLALSAIDALYTYLPAVADHRSMSASSVSAMLMVFGLSAMLSRTCLGLITRVWGKRRSITFGCIISAGTLVAFCAPLEYWLALVVVGVFGFMCGMIQPLTMSWTSDLAPSNARGIVTSLRMLGNRIGQTGLPAISGLVMTLLGASAAFALCGATMAVAAATVQRSRYWEPVTDPGAISRA
jgi:predicted MFS family arabinose efflux permease